MVSVTTLADDTELKEHRLSAATAFLRTLSTNGSRRNAPSKLKDAGQPRKGRGTFMKNNLLPANGWYRLQSSERYCFDPGSGPGTYLIWP